MLGDMRCHTGCTPSHLDTVHRTEIDIFSYEYMGNIFISCTSRAAVGSSIVGHCSSGIHVPRNSTSPLGQKHPANTLSSPQVQVHKSVRFEKSTWIAFFATDWVEASTCWGTCTATLVVLHQTRTLFG